MIIISCYGTIEIFGIKQDRSIHKHPKFYHSADGFYLYRKNNNIHRKLPKPAVHCVDGTLEYWTNGECLGVWNPITQTGYRG